MKALAAKGTRPVPAVTGQPWSPECRGRQTASRRPGNSDCAGDLPHWPLPCALFLGDLAALGIVQQDVSDIHLVFDGRREVRLVLPEAAVADHRYHLVTPVHLLILRRRKRE